VHASPEFEVALNIIIVAVELLYDHIILPDIIAMPLGGGG
jgi:hypothetical protein